MGCGASSVSLEGPADPGHVAIDHFVRGRQVGEGGFGKVIAMRHYKTGRWFAMKELTKKTVVTSKSVAMIFNERNLLSVLPYTPFIINAYHACQDEHNCYLFMDLAMGGDLRFHLRKTKGKLKEKRVRFYTLCIVLALEFLHKSSIVHRDVKPENVVLNGKGYAMLTDLGISKKVNADGVVSGKSGTRAYMAPECFEGDNIQTYLSDCWSLGVLTYEIARGSSKGLECTSVDGLKDKAGMSTGCAEFCERCLQLEPLNRSTAADLLTVAWFASYDLEKFRSQEAEPPWMPDPKQVYFNMALSDMDAAFGGSDNFRSVSSGLLSNTAKKKESCPDDEFKGYDWNLEVVGDAVETRKVEAPE